MPDLVKVWTRDEVLALPDDGNRYELVDGALLVSPSPRPLHQLGVGEFYRLIEAYARTSRLGDVLMSPSDLDLRSGQLVQPDLFVVRTADGRRLREWPDVGIPLLVVEILSPATARYDRITKRRLYQRLGVPVYWIVDLDARLVEVWTPSDTAPGIVDRQLTWRPDSGTPVLSIDLPSCFQAVWGE